MRRVLIVLVTALLVGLAGCSGSGSSNTMTPQQRLDAAKKSFDHAAFIGFHLHTDSLPSSVNGLLSADGTGTHAPAFDGKVQVKTTLTIVAPLIAVGGKVYAKLPFVGWSVVNPADYGAPDPANLMAPSGGISSLFTKTTNLSVGGQQRNGTTVLTPISGTLPATAVKSVFPSSGTGLYHVTYLLTDSNDVSTVTMTGPFYGDRGAVTYVIELDLHAAAVAIKAPSL